MSSRPFWKSKFWSARFLENHQKMIFDMYCKVCYIYHDFTCTNSQPWLLLFFPLGFLCVTAEAFSGFILCLLLASCVSVLKPSQALSFASPWLLVCQCWSLLRLYPLPPLGFLCVSAEAFSGFILCCHCWQIWICSMGLFQTSTWAAIFLQPSSFVEKSFCC